MNAMATSAFIVNIVEPYLEVTRKLNQIPAFSLKNEDTATRLFGWERDCRRIQIAICICTGSYFWLGEGIYIKIFSLTL